MTSRLIGLANNLKLIPSRHLSTLINQNLTKAVDRFKPDYLLVIKGETLTPQTIKAIAGKGTKTINWYPDWWIAWDWLKSHAPAYQFFLSACLDTNKKLKQIGVNSHYLTFAGQPKQLQKISKIYPISFIGQYSPVREKYFRPLKNLGLQIWGYQDWQTSSLSSISHSPVSVAKAHHIISHSHLVVNLLAQVGQLHPHGLNVRTFETTALGTCLLVKDHPVLKKYFQPGKDVVTFTTPADLYKKARYYLQHNQEREKIARAGYRRTKQDHTFTIRLKQMFQIINP